MTAQRALRVALDAIDFVRSELEGSDIWPLLWPDIDEARGYIAAAHAKMPEVKALHEGWKAESERQRAEDLAAEEAMRVRNISTQGPL